MVTHLKRLSYESREHCLSRISPHLSLLLMIRPSPPILFRVLSVDTRNLRCNSMGPIFLRSCYFFFLKANVHQEAFLDVVVTLEDPLLAERYMD